MGNIDKKEILIRKNKGKTYWVKYLEELGALVLNEDDLESKILSVEDTIHFMDLRRSIIEEEKSEPFVKTVKFEEKGVYLNRVKDQLSAIDEKPLYLFTDYSKYCGILKFSTISSFNTSFEFSDEHGGLISIISENLQNRVLLDFYEKEGTQILEIEISGNKWLEQLRV